MKSLSSVLLITTFAIASSVAIQEVLQAGVGASTLDSPSPATIMEEALWHKKHPHPHHHHNHHHHNPHHHNPHHHKKCRNKIITLPFPECGQKCKAKCGSGKQGCDLKCGLYENKCKD
ncbi:hypothetical protein BGZ58_008670, partial [Dissophora ornata]